MNRFSISVLIIFVLVSCKNRKSNSASNSFENLQKQGFSDTTEKKPLRDCDSLKSSYGDSLTSVSDIYINEVDTSGQVESQVIDIIVNLKEVKDRAEFVRMQTNGQRHLEYMIWQKPTSNQPYYWIKVLEDNGTNSHTHFNFFVKLKQFQISYYDSINDTLLDLAAWRKRIAP